MMMTCQKEKKILRTITKKKKLRPPLIPLIVAGFAGRDRTAGIGEITRPL